jgi:hypothetical protein
MALFDRLRSSRKSPDGPEFKVTGLEKTETITNGDIRASYVLIDESGNRHKYRSPRDMPPGVREQFEQWEANDRIRDALSPEPDISTMYPTEWGQTPSHDRSDPSDRPDSKSWSHTSKRTFVTVSQLCPECEHEIVQTNPKPGEPYTCTNCGTTFVDHAPGQSLEELHRAVESKLLSPEAIRATRKRWGDTVIADGIQEVCSLSSYAGRELAIRARDALKHAGIDAVLSFDMEPGAGDEESTNLELCVPLADAEKATGIIETLDLCEPYAVAAFTDTALAEGACEAMKQAGLQVSLQYDYHDDNVGSGTALMIKPRDWEKVKDIMDQHDLVPHDVLGTYTDVSRAQEARTMLEQEGIDVLLQHVANHPHFGTGTALLARPSVSERVADLLVGKNMLPDNLGPEE